MPDELADLLNRVAATLPTVAWVEPDELRRIAQVRRQRRNGLVAFLVVVVVGLGGAGIARLSGGYTTLPPAATTTPTRTPTPAPSCRLGQMPVNLDLPERGEIMVNVYNGSGVAGMGTSVGAELRVRGFVVPSTAEVAADHVYDEVAVIRFGPSAVGAAWLMRAYFADRAKTEFDMGRSDVAIDIILGARFDSLATVTEVNQIIAALGLPTPPPGTCAGNTRVSPTALLTAEDIGLMYTSDTNATTQEWRLAFLNVLCPRASTAAFPEMGALASASQHFRGPDGQIFQFVNIYTQAGVRFQLEQIRQFINGCAHIEFEGSHFTVEIVGTQFAGEDSLLVKVTPIDMAGTPVRHHIFIREGTTITEIVLIGDSLASRYLEIATRASVRLAGSVD